MISNDLQSTATTRPSVLAWNLCLKTRSNFCSRWYLMSTFFTASLRYTDLSHCAMLYSNKTLHMRVPRLSHRSLFIPQLTTKIHRSDPASSHPMTNSFHLAINQGSTLAASSVDWTHIVAFFSRETSPLLCNLRRFWPLPVTFGVTSTGSTVKIAHLPFVHVDLQ